MDESALRFLLDGSAGDVDADEVVRLVRRLPFTELGYAMVDHHRDPPPGPARSRLRAGQDPRPVRRASSPSCWSERVRTPGRPGRAHPGRPTTKSPRRWRAARMAGSPGRRSSGAPRRRGPKRWSSSRPAPPTCRWRGSAGPPCGPSGSGPPLVADGGVAGLHRLLAHVELLQAADAVVVVAGMEGALASVVGGLSAAPGRGRPDQRRATGPAWSGMTALLAMLASCASGMVVVGIDNGFGAACAVARILRPRTGGPMTPAAGPTAARPERAERPNEPPAERTGR